MKPSLRSNNSGYQYYKVTLEGDIDKIGNLISIYILISYILLRVHVHLS